MHIFIKAPTLLSCPKCGKPLLPHRVCQNCGYYKGKQIVDVFKKLTKKERKEKEKELKAAQKVPKKELSIEELSRK